MNEYLLRRLSPTENLNKIVPIIKEAFIEFYGENKRQHIEEKFNKIILLGSFNPTSIKRFIQDLYKDYTNNSLKKLCKEMKIENIDEFIKKYFYGDSFNGYSFEEVSSMPINQYWEYKKINQTASSEKKQELKEKAVAFLKTIDSKINIENIDEFIKLKKFEYLDRICLKMDELLVEFKEIEGNMKPYKDYCLKCDELKLKLEDSYMKKLITEFTKSMKEEDLKNYLDDKILSTKPNLKHFFGYSLHDTSYIDCFSEENENILLTDKKDWRKDSIERDRIRFFNAKGIYLGDDYEAYKSSSECNAIIPSQNLIKSLHEAKLKYEALFQNEYYTSIQEFREHRELIDKQNLLCKDDDYDASIFMHGKTFVSPNAILENNQLVLYPLVNINFDYISATHDVAIIHEFNHLYELSLLGNNEDNISFLCGWDYLSQNLTKNSTLIEAEESRNGRDYELFNETINEIIAQKISAIIQEKGNHFFNTPEEAKIKGGSSYEKTMFLVRDFYNEFETDIIESREKGNINHIFDVVGKENFDNLNELFHIFNDRWSGVNYRSLANALMKKIETDDTKKYFELKERRDVILEQMRKHKAIYIKNNQVK